MTDQNLAKIFGLTGLRVIITGAGAGLGAETAYLIASLGAHVALLDIDEGGSAAVARWIAEAGGIAHSVQLDLRNEKSCETAIAESVQALGGFEAIIHFGGIYPKIGLLDLDAAQWDAVHEINARGTMFIVREAVRAFIAGGKGGRIVNVSSIAGARVSVDNHYAYGSSKAAVNALTRAAAYEFGSHGILVNAIMPGMILSQHARKAISSSDAPPTGPMVQPGRILLGRGGEPSEIASVAAFLIGPGASYITGQCIAVDGGFDVS